MNYHPKSYNELALTQKGWHTHNGTIFGEHWQSRLDTNSKQGLKREYDNTYSDTAAVYFDLETTGLDTRRDEIVEIFCVRIEGKLISTAKWRIKPKMAIPTQVIKIHGITDRHVKDCPSFEIVADEIGRFMRGSVLIGYNIERFDLPMLINHFKRAQIMFPECIPGFIDTYQLIKEITGRSFKLTNASKEILNKEHDYAHLAEYDVYRTIELTERITTPPYKCKYTWLCNYYHQIMHDHIPNIAGFSPFQVPKRENILYRDPWDLDYRDAYEWHFPVYNIDK